MYAPYILRIRTVSNSDGLYGAYDPSTALSIRTLTIRADRTDRTNRNTLCSDVIMRCTLRMCSEYGPLATLTVCSERTIRQLLFTVRNSATVLDMTDSVGRVGENPGNEVVCYPTYLGSPTRCKQTLKRDGKSLTCYVKGIPFLPKMTYKKGRSKTVGRSLPVKNFAVKPLACGS